MCLLKNKLAVLASIYCLAIWLFYLPSNTHMLYYYLYR
nr:MAG TPA: hypothetical protein [Caudoviricetes sp.]